MLTCKAEKRAYRWLLGANTKLKDPWIQVNLELLRLNLAVRWSEGHGPQMQCSRR